MKRLIALVITMMVALAYYGPTLANEQDPTSGSIIVILDGKAYLSLDTANCNGIPHKLSHLLVTDNQGNTVIKEDFIDETVAISSSAWPAGGYTIELWNNGCVVSSPFSKQQ